MAAFLLIVLLLSCAGMITLLWLKRYELNTGTMFFVQVRPAMGEFFSRSLIWIEHVLPGLAAREIRRAYAWARAASQRALARAIIVAERLLEQVLHALRRKTDAPRQTGEASPFLREVAEHKKKLLEDRIEE